MNNRESSPARSSGQVTQSNYEYQEFKVGRLVLFAVLATAMFTAAYFLIP